MTGKPAKDLPRGRAEVKQALLEAAAELLSASGPSAISIRDIAAAARVNHGLVHRHFGSKEALVREVMEMLGAEVASLPTSPTSKADGLPLSMLLRVGQSRYLRVLVRALLDGTEITDLQERFPIVDALLETARQAKKEGKLRPDTDPRMAVALAMALGFGWLLFEPFIIAAVGLKKSPMALRRELASTMLGLFRSTPDNNE